jgi:hypothetical protein
LTVVSELLGHSDISTTAGYLTPSAADLQAATQQLKKEWYTMQQQEQWQDDELRHEWHFAGFEEDDMGISVSLVCHQCNGEVCITRDFDNTCPCSGQFPDDGAVWELEVHEPEEQN